MTAMLPIVGREMRLAARQRQLQRLRFCAALVAMSVTFLLLLAAPGSSSPEATAQVLLVLLSALTALACLFAGAFLTADCLSSEKRQGTLGLLFLTDLKPYDIVFGKLAANGLQAFSGLLAVLPVFALPL